MATADPLLNMVVAGRYRIVHRIGEGQLGTVYYAEHAELKTPVAIKMLHKQLCEDEVLIDQLRQTLSRVAHLESDHVVRISDTGRFDDGRLYIAMQYLEGESLAMRLGRQGTLELREVIFLVEQLIDILAEAHQHRLYHLDLRPQNIFIVKKKERDFIKLLDLGFSTIYRRTQAHSDEKSGSFGMRSQDPRYLAPEQIRNLDSDGRSDIYALACIIFQMISGAPPFMGNGAFEVMMKQLEADVPLLHERVAHVPVPLSLAIHRALNKDLHARPATVAEFWKLMNESPSTEPASMAGTTTESAPKDPAHGAKSPLVGDSRSDTRRIPTKFTTAPNPMTAGKTVIGLGISAADVAREVSVLSASTPLSDVKESNATVVGIPKSHESTSTKDSHGGVRSHGRIATPMLTDVNQGKGITAEDVAAVVAKRRTASGAVRVPSAQELGGISLQKATPLTDSPPSAPIPSVVELSHEPYRVPGAKEILVPPPLPPEAMEDAVPPVVVGVTIDDKLQRLSEASANALQPELFSAKTIVPNRMIAPQVPNEPSVKRERESAVPQTGAIEAPGVSSWDDPVSSTPSSPSDSGSWFLQGVEAEKTFGSGGQSDALRSIYEELEEEEAQRRRNSPAWIISGVILAAGVIFGVILYFNSESQHKSASQVTIARMEDADAGPTKAKRATIDVSGIIADSSMKPSIVDAGMAQHADAAQPTPVTLGTEPKVETKPEQKVAAKTDLAKTEPAARVVKEPKGETPTEKTDRGTTQARTESSRETGTVRINDMVAQGRDALRKGNYNKAKLSFTQALKIDANNGASHAGLGEIAFEEGKYAVADWHLQKAVKLEPNNDAYLVLLGDVYFKQRKTAQAIASYRRALKLNPRNAAARRGLNAVR